MSTCSSLLSPKGSMEGGGFSGDGAGSTVAARCVDGTWWLALALPAASLTPPEQLVRGVELCQVPPASNQSQACILRLLSG